MTAASHHPAFAYLEAGIALLPIPANSKKPFGRWKRWMEGPMTRVQAASWWAGAITTNVGIITGAPSGGLVVIDIEPEHVPIVPQLDLPAGAPRVRTARGGLHVYCYGPEYGCGKLRFQGVTIGDIRGTGGYVVAPPSKINGSAYEWLPWRPFKVADLPPVPDWVRPPKRTPTGGRLSSARPPVGVRVDPQELAGLMASPIRAALDTGFYRGGAFCSASELDFRIVREAIHAWADYESIESFILSGQAGDNFFKHLDKDPDYVSRTYDAALAFAEDDVLDAVEMRCCRYVHMPGGIAGGARSRLLCDFEPVEGGELCSYTVPVVLGPPFTGELAGEWRQTAAAYGAAASPDPDEVVTNSNVLVYTKERRVVRLLHPGWWTLLGR